VSELRSGIYRFDRWRPEHWEAQCRGWTSAGVPLPGTKISGGKPTV
jgi:hypothetical protein